MAAVNCLWMLAALSRPQAGTSTLLQPPAPVRVVTACITPACLKQKLLRVRGTEGTAVTLWPFSRSLEAQKGSHFVRQHDEVGRVTKEAGERGSAGAGGHVKWRLFPSSFLNLVPHGEFWFEQFSELKVPLCTELTCASEYLVAGWRNNDIQPRNFILVGLIPRKYKIQTWRVMRLNIKRSSSLSAVAV